MKGPVVRVRNGPRRHGYQGLTLIATILMAVPLLVFGGARPRPD